MPLKRDIKKQFRVRRIVPRFAHSVAEIQSAVPSQDHPLGVPFNPGLQPDMKAPVRTIRRPFMQQGDNPDQGPQLPDDLADVRHVWDARPPNAYDIWFEDRFQGSGNNNTAGVFGPTLGGYRVPDGYNLFLRKMNISVWANPFAIAAIGATNQAWAPNTLFQLEFTPKLSVLVDGAATPFFTAANSFPIIDPNFPPPGIPLMFPTMHDYEIPCFIPVAGGSVVTANFVIDGPGATNVPDNFIFFVQYHGNLISDTGRSLSNEVGNSDPLPVINDGG